MAKLSLNTLQSGFLSITKMGENFTDIELEFQNKVLYRDNPAGEPNGMENDLDMNSRRILNLVSPISDAEPARWIDVKNGVTTVDTVMPSFSGNTKKMLSTDGSALVFKDSEDLLYKHGAASSVNRDVADKLREFVTPEDFGAVGDGTTDDSVQVQLALDSGFSVYFPRGTTYLVTDLDMTVSDTQVWGGGTLKLVGTSGVGNEVLKISGNRNAISGINIDGNQGTGTPALGRGVLISGAGNTLVAVFSKDTDIVSGGGHAFAISGPDNTLIACEALNAGYGGFKTFDGSHRTLLFGCRTNGHHIKGIVHNGDSDLLTIENFYAQSSVVDIEENMLLDAGVGKLLKKAVLINVTLADNPNHDATGNGAKFSLLTDLYIDKCSFEQVSTVASTVRLQDGPVNVYIRDSFFAKDINGGADGILKILSITDTIIGEKGVSGSIASLDGIDAPRVSLERVTFNDYTTIAIDMEGVDQFLSCIDCVFDRDTTGNVIQTSGAGSLVTSRKWMFVGETIVSGGSLTASSNTTALIARDYRRRTSYKNTIPTIGTFTTGDFVSVEAVSVDGNGRYLDGWQRIVSGSLHALNTDWVGVWISTATWV